MSVFRNRVWLLPLLLSAALFGCDEGPLYAVGTLERDRIELAADSGEPIVAIPVAEGDRVEAGTRLLEQDPARAEAQLAQARSARDEAVAQLEEAVAGPRAQDIAQGEARLAAAESAVITARQELHREQTLRARNFVSPNRLDVLQGRYDEAMARQREAEAALDQLREGTRTEVVQRARQALARTESRVRELEIQLARTTVTAPLDATVEALPLEIGERPGAGQTVVVLRALGPTFARVYVPEPLRARVDVGVAAEVYLDGRDAPLDARVRWIATEAAFTPYFALTQRDRSRLSYLAEVVLTGEAAGTLPVGVPVEVRFPASGP
jgi:HlyD family secretion protein